MNRTPVRRLAAAVLAAAAALSLSGCLYAQIPESAPTAPSPTAGPQTDTPADEPTGGTTLSFAEGTELSADAYIEWGDGLLTHDRWKTVAPDDGNGGWTYGTVDGTCTAQFWQGLIADVPTVSGDDSVSSDAILGVLLQSTTTDITPHAKTGEFSYLSGGTGGVENRWVAGGDGDRSWIMAARAFTKTGVGLYVIVDCTGADPAAIMDEVNEANAIVVTP
ncbi:hypothetical protein M4D51_15570 [Microbacterium sp. p3-SID338]|uniref:hypothetical protein n=1 Tax=unclassified Microbacterium TaxID=2609290 RepID=UPI000C802FE2|nr:MULTISPECIES: hypothetical protein [unclassified Microbacterium]MCT1397144.1 hypothetical protein [Microbacterium sp. p3-SID338]PMC03027.1 hypothetical protein CJ226_13610 [Microbacterium sp. UMB0228]